MQGLPIPEESCDAAYCSHVLEHLTLEDCRAALRNTYRYLKPGGVFRMVLPDLETHVRHYIEKADADAAIKFMTWTKLGHVQRPVGLVQRLRKIFGSRAHLWMWDYKALELELSQIGFRSIRRCRFGDATDQSFKLVEARERFEYALAVECIKPDH